MDINYLSYGDGADTFVIKECKKIQDSLDAGNCTIIDLIKPLVLNGKSEWIEIAPVDLDIADYAFDSRDEDEFKNQGGKILFTIKIPSKLFFDADFLKPMTTN